ncbi:hypothetical protein SEA_DUDELITTLE_44 [Mycobacterium phage DudeLittle]|nr:hypothetical protein SEA_DUDELITTLE_44 [Mycobacterium phage DudeLittle]
MLVKDVERYTIPISRDFAGALPPKEGTTVEELIQALKKLPKDGIVSTDFGNGDVIVMHYKPDIDSKPDAWEEAAAESIRYFAAATGIPEQYLSAKP